MPLVTAETEAVAGNSVQQTTYLCHGHRVTAKRLSIFLISRIRTVRGGKWTARHGKCPVNNFNCQFNTILAHAKIEQGGFHDLRRTCLTMWFANSLSEYDVMNLAGHAEFETTRQLYLAVREDLLQCVRAASTEAMNSNLVAHLLRARFGT